MQLNDRERHLIIGALNNELSEYQDFYAICSDTNRLERYSKCIDELLELMQKINNER